jgi:hypothetical protein
MFRLDVEIKKIPKTQILRDSAEFSVQYLKIAIQKTLFGTAKSNSRT